jgi:hypothetical protein
MNQRSELAVQTTWFEHGLVRDRGRTVPLRVLVRCCEPDAQPNLLRESSSTITESSGSIGAADSYCGYCL